jgi:hypothetical protein
MNNLSDLSSISSISSISTLETKIRIEKRKRNQVYSSLDYFLSSLSYFDFFSATSFDLIKYSKQLSLYFNEKKVTKEMILLAFFFVENPVLNLLEDFEIDKEKIIENYFPKKKSVFQHFKDFKNNILDLLNLQQTENLELSSELNDFFEKVAENALRRFKTPVITSEIIFLTFLEEKDYCYFKLFRDTVSNDSVEYLLRYQLLKNIHYKESNIRSNVIKNQHYFTYLLQTKLSEKNFKQLIKRELLQEGTFVFRNDLIGKLLKQDFFKLLLKDTFISLQLRNTRKYTLS